MSIEDAFAIKPGSPYYWGPRLWRIFHNLAEISDRRDIGMLWSNVLRATSAAMPCAKCREHLAYYLKHNTILKITNPLKVTGAEIRTQIRRQLLNLHNTVNIRNDKPVFTEDELLEMYGGRDRNTILAETHELLNEVKTAWTPLLHSSINPADFAQWKHMLLILTSLLSGGTY